MRQLWSEERKFEIWLEIETLACEAMAGLGQIPNEDAAEIREKARFSIPEIARDRETDEPRRDRVPGKRRGLSRARPRAGCTRG